MSIMTLLFPHKALREALSRIRDHEATILSQHRRLCERERLIREQEATIASKDSRIRLQKEEIMRLNDITKATDNGSKFD